MKKNLEPPKNLEAEKNVLGSMMLDNKCIPEISEKLIDEVFFDKKNETIYRAITELADENIPVDSVSLFEWLKKSGGLELAGGGGYIATLTDNISSSANANYLSIIILENWIKRKTIEVGKEIIERAYGDGDVFELLSFAESSIFSITSNIHKKNAVEIKKVFNDVLSHIQAVRQGSNLYSIPTNFYDLDNILGGLKKSDLIIVAARPSMGKTAFALDVMLQTEAPCLMFSLEMGNLALGARILSKQTGVSVNDILNAKFKKDLDADIFRKVERFRQRIFLDDTPANNIVRMRSIARQVKAKESIKLVVVDYLQLVDGGDAEKREQEISKISRSLKAMAKELDIPVIALAQLNRGVEARSDKRPLLSDIRESGSIEQDADVVMFLYRPEVYKIPELDGMPSEGLAEVIVAKHRNGSIGSIKLRFEKETATFQNRENNYVNLPEYQREIF